jgi:hypothetical protein
VFPLPLPLTNQHVTSRRITFIASPSSRRVRLPCFGCTGTLRANTHTAGAAAAASFAGARISGSTLMTIGVQRAHSSGCLSSPPQSVV